MPDRMSERMSDCMPECQIESQKNKYAIYTSRWYVRNYVRIAFKGGTYSKKAFIPECVAKGSRFTLVWGLRFDVFARRCFCVRKCPQPTATDRNRPQPFGSVCERPSRGQHGRAYSEFCKSGHPSNFKRRVPLFGVAGVALCDRCFIRCPKTFCVTGAIFLRHCQKAQQFENVHRHFAWQAELQTRVACFCETQCQDCVKWWPRKLRGRRGTSSFCVARTAWRSVLCGMSFCAPGAVFSILYTPHFTLIHFTLIHFTLTLYTPHSTLYTSQFTLGTPHSTLYTSHSKIRTSQYTLHSPLNTPLSSRSTLGTPPPSTFHSLPCTGTVKWENGKMHNTCFMWLHAGTFFLALGKFREHV